MSDQKKLQDAYCVLRDHITVDVDYWRGWHSNLTMSMYDSGVELEHAREAADRFLNLLFSSKMTYAEYQQMSEMAADRLLPAKNAPDNSI